MVVDKYGYMESVYHSEVYLELQTSKMKFFLKIA